MLFQRKNIVGFSGLNFQNTYAYICIRRLSYLAKWLNFYYFPSFQKQNYMYITYCFKPHLNKYMYMKWLCYLKMGKINSSKPIIYRQHSVHLTQISSPVETFLILSQYMYEVNVNSKSYNLHVYHWQIL